MVYTELAPRRQHVAGRQRCKYTVSIGCLDGDSKRALQLWQWLLRHRETCATRALWVWWETNNNAIVATVKRLELISRWGVRQVFMYTDNDFKGRHGAVMKSSVDRTNRENLRCLLATERTTVEHLRGRHQLCIQISTCSHTSYHSVQAKIAIFNQYWWLAIIFISIIL